METIMATETQVFIKERVGVKNDFYLKNLDTAPGKLKDLKIPKDREGKFRTKRSLYSVINDKKAL